MHLDTSPGREAGTRCRGAVPDATPHPHSGHMGHKAELCLALVRDGLGDVLVCTWPRACTGMNPGSPACCEWTLPLTPSWGLRVGVGEAGVWQNSVEGGGARPQERERCSGQQVPDTWQLHNLTPAPSPGDGQLPLSLRGLVPCGHTSCLSLSLFPLSGREAVHVEFYMKLTANISDHALLLPKIV